MWPIEHIDVVGACLLISTVSLACLATAAMTQPRQSIELPQSDEDVFLVTRSQRRAIRSRLLHWKRAAESNSGNHINGNARTESTK